LPEWAMVSLIDASPFDAGTAYVAVDAHKLDNFKPYIFKTSDFGKSWTKITAGLPENDYVHAVREDPGRKGLLYAGTETGVWVSFDDGAHWQALQMNLPNAPIHDLIVHDNDLTVATHGRSFWVLDDLAPLRQMTAAIAGEDAHLFAPSIATRTRIGHVEPRRYPIGENPPSGAVLYYWLKEAPKEPAKLEVLDAQGKVVRSYTSEAKKTAEAPEEGERDEPPETIPAAAGLNRFAWDLHYEPPVKIPAAIYDGDNQPAGPHAMPGKYSVRLTVSGKSYTQPLEIVMDPRVKTSVADLQKQFDFLLKLRERQDAMNRAILGIRDLRGQLQAMEKRYAASESAKTVVTAAAGLRKRITALEEELIQVNATASEDEANYPTKLNSKLSYLNGVTDSADAAPTPAEEAVFVDLDKQLETQLAVWHEVLAKDVPALNEAMQKNGVPLIGVAPEAKR